MITTAPLFRPLGRELIELLRSLPAEDWRRPTSAAAWTVKDVAAHILDTDLRRVSAMRDGFLAPRPKSGLSGPGALLAWLNDLNAEWVSALRRVSPDVLVDHLELSSAALADVMERADPLADATFPVAWAGQDSSPMWLDIGREYTERWHHQDQIREAVGAPPQRSVRWLTPVLEISVLALPHAYRSLAAPRGTEVVIRVTGEAAGEWRLVRTQGWTLSQKPLGEPACMVTADDLAMARLLLHRLTPAAARSALLVEGDPSLAEPLIAARAVMV